MTLHWLGEHAQARVLLDAAVAAASPHEGWPHVARAGPLLLAGALPAVSADLAEAHRREPDAPVTLALAAIPLVRQGGPVVGTAPPGMEEVRVIFGPWLPN